VMTFKVHPPATDAPGVHHRFLRYALFEKPDDQVIVGHFWK